jgi:predicted Zn finger-like uncharacterized protein
VKISCPTCAAKYSVADEKIQSRLAKIRCRKCSSTIVIDGTASPASVYIGEASMPAPGAVPNELGAAEGSAGGGRPSGLGFSDAAPTLADPVGPAADEYAVDIADNDQRNMTIHQIVGAYNEGIISADTYIWKEGMADWQTLAEVRAVANALHAAARPGATAMPAAVRRADHGASADLFGRIETAGSEDDITTSAPEAAPGVSAGTGARNESSVLFSLSALTGTPDATNTPGGGGKRGRGTADDSGLIDLQALTAQEAASGGGYSASSGGFGSGGFGASPLISAPLGGVSGPALGAALGAGYGRRSGSRTLIISASVLALVIIGGAAAVIANRGAVEDEATSSLDKAAASAPEKPTAEPVQPARVEGASRKEQPIAEAVGDSVAADELPAAAPEPAAVKPAPAPRAPVARAPRTPVRAKPPAPTPAPAPEPVAAPVQVSSESAAARDPEAKKKKPPATRCECKPGDLMCAMRCSAKK